MMHAPESIRTGTRLLLTALVILGAALLAGCSDGDWDLLAALAEDWAASNGVWDGENLDMGRLTRMGVQEQIDALLNGPPPALEAASVVDDIRETERLATQGLEEGGALGATSVEKAIAMRPRDWSLWEKKGAILMAMGRTQEAEDAFATSAALARSHLATGGDCKLYQRNLLTQREQALLSQINRLYAIDQQPPDDLIDRLDSVRAELGLLDTAAGSCG